jgi:1-deoxy-D-xylulose-5-phosphate reductoisomerase
MRRIALLGSTGSIGRQALDVIASYPDRFCVAALAANANITLLAEQTQRFNPAVVSAGNATAAAGLSKLLRRRCQVVCGEDGLVAAATQSHADVVLAATDGTVALRAVVESIKQGGHVAIANKELLVGAGDLLCELARTHRATIVPVDSEHSALFQCLLGERREAVASVVITASGGPFWDLTVAQMERATPEEALAHPIWSMGAKNTLDSATLMNKGLEMIEASHLFALDPTQIAVVVHRQSIVHGLVLFVDGNVKAQLAAPDMRLPIGYALSYPQRLPGPIAEQRTKRALGLEQVASTLSFEPVDDSRFPSVRLAYHARKRGETYPAVLSGANQEAGRAFLQRQIKFTEICAIVERALAAHEPTGRNLEAIEAADQFGRAFARDAVSAAMRR